MYSMLHGDVCYFSLYFVKYKPHENIQYKFIDLSEIYVLSNTHFFVW